MIFGLYQAHSGWRYIVILLVVLVIAKALFGWFTNGRWSKLDHYLGLSTPISIDIQWLLGIVLWILQQPWTRGDAMVSWEHPVTMTVMLAVGHITWSRVKRTEDDGQKYRTAAIGFIIAGLILALGVARITRVM